jgi:hypothetical protein
LQAGEQPVGEVDSGVEMESSGSRPKLPMEKPTG